MRELCLSSELYPVSPADIAALADTPADLQQHVKDEITVLIGDSQNGQTDTLLSGRPLQDFFLQHISYCPA